MKHLCTQYNLNLDHEFQRLTPPLPPEEYVKLEHEIRLHGCPNPLIVWQKNLLIGFAEYDICRKWNIPYEITSIFFSSREEAVSSICKNSLSRTDLSNEYVRYCIGKLFEAQIAVAEQSPTQDNNRENHLSDNPQYKPSLKTYVCEMISKKYHIRPHTVAKYGAYASAIDTISESSRDIASELLEGIFRLSQKNSIELSQLPEEEMQLVRDHMMRNKDIRILHSSLIRTRQTEKAAALKTAGKKMAQSSKPEIKQMPKYDPDAELSSLSLTIPMWISSIKRFLSIAGFQEATPQAVQKLSETLTALNDTIKLLEETIKENTL